MGFWTPAKIEILETEWKAGASVRAIADRLACSRNTIIGKARRLELPMHADSRFHPDRQKQRKEKKPDARKPRNGPPRIRRVNRAAPAPAPPSEPPLPPSPPPTEASAALRIAFLALAPWHCRYPVSDDAPFVFCGHARHGKSSFCAFHHALCYVPLRSRPRGERQDNPARSFARAA